PPEELTAMGTAWRGRPTVIIEASIEMLSLAQRSKHTLGPLVKVLQSEIRTARAGGGRGHHPELIQEWVDRAGEVWNSSSGRFRLWLEFHTSPARSTDRKSTRLNSSHSQISYAVFCLKKKK